ncbi:MAG: molybdenum ABC transporter permease [Halobacteria archaeon]|nr:molybdenum ABC transporter permease [Halobacteria archaeon]
MFPTKSETETKDETRKGTKTTDWISVSLVLGVVLLVYYLVPILTLLVSQSPTETVVRMNEGYVVTATVNSILTASISTFIATVLGLPLAYWLARTSFSGKDLITTAVILPLVLPPIVSGMLLLEVFGPEGIGGLLGFKFTRSFLGIVLAQTFVASPFLVITSKAAFESVDRHLEYASRSLGKDEWTTLKRITLPLAKPGIVAGVTLTFARAIGEFGATIMMAYYPRTMPVQIWVSYISTGLDSALPLAIILVVVAVGTLLILNIAGSNAWR